MATQMTDAEFEAMKDMVLNTFDQPLRKFFAETKGRGFNSEHFTALAIFFGHALGGAAVYLGVAKSKGIVAATSEIVAESMADDIAAQYFDAGERV